VDEADQGAEALEGATALLPFKVTDAALANLARIAAPATPLDAFCPNIAATLLLSTLVGMRLPGRRAVFMRFAMKFAADVVKDLEGELHGRVTKVSAVSESLAAEVRITQQRAEIATGEVHALVSQAPSRMLSAETIRREHLELGLAGKVVVVIGASRGIGETAAKLFAMHGAQVVVHYFRGRHDAESIVAEIAAAGGTAKALQCDVRDEAAVGRFFAEVDAAFGGVDVLVNNAVVDFQPKPAAELTWPDFLGELEVSLKGLHACCQAALPRMKARGGGKIVNVSTVAVDQPVRGQGKYITAKSAVAGYTKSLAVEVLKDNIQVNLVVPAMTENRPARLDPGRLRAAHRQRARHGAQRPPDRGGPGDALPGVGLVGGAERSAAGVEPRRVAVRLMPHEAQHDFVVRRVAQHEIAGVEADQRHRRARQVGDHQPLQAAIDR
jgi:3-oxoacyl-[acyl-carrier protein] reductase